MIEPNPPIYFVRHGETDWNREGRIQGQIDIPLNDTGHCSRSAVARALKSCLGDTRIDRFVVSPLTRARQTMGYLARELRPSRTSHRGRARLQELGFRHLGGPSLQGTQADPRLSAATPHERYHWRPEDGESYADGVNVWHNGSADLDGPTVIVAHGAIGRCIVGLAAGLKAEQLVLTEMPQGRFCRLMNGRMDWFDESGSPA